MAKDKVDRLVALKGGVKALNAALVSCRTAVKMLSIQAEFPDTISAAAISKAIAQVKEKMHDAVDVVTGM